MRPDILFPLFAPIDSLPGVGPRFAKLFERLAGSKVVDLLWHLPVGITDRRFSPPLSQAPPGAVVTLTLMVHEHLPPSAKGRPYRVVCGDDGGGRLTLIYFHAKPDYLRRLLPVGARRVVSGKVERFGETLQMAHPDHVVPPEERDTVRRVEPQYGLTAGLSPKVVAKAVKSALDRTPDLPEWQDPAWLSRNGGKDWKAALSEAHAPAAAQDLSPMAEARRRLAYDELLANQLALGIVRAALRKQAGRSLRGDGRLRERCVQALPFTLTGAQRRALAEIEADMAAPERMLRLLQGDVGSGKTVVAFLSMLNAVECGAQAALMAPTEILARQHFQTIAPLAERTGLEIVCLSGRDKGKARAAVLDALASGKAHMAVGTHALFSQDVAFRDLGIAVIDEQHRFGVHQRLELAGKGRAADVLVMTATPIPRTLQMTAYGDLDASRLDEKPPGRTPIKTSAMPVSRLDEVIAAVRRAVAGGAKVFWVCPLVEESEVTDTVAAEERHAALRAIDGIRVGLAHGRMKAAEKDAVMAAFAGDGLDVLVATTVIEVGVDVPDATVMVIEHAQRFGLAQLHQLRGRIGRGKGASSCLLLYAPPLTETAKARLQVMRETDDGFRIAEEDLRLRGGGEILGTRQSGLPDFRLADLAVHGELLAAARDDARLILERDPHLEGARGRALRVLLYLFERDSVVKTLRSG